MTIDGGLTSTKKISWFTVVGVLGTSLGGWYLIGIAGMSAYGALEPIVRPLVGL
jgi:hypothetical protein